MAIGGLAFGRACLQSSRKMVPDELNPSPPPNTRNKFLLLFFHQINGPISVIPAKFSTSRRHIEERIPSVSITR
jgi:hypothetical protein